MEDKRTRNDVTLKKVLALEPGSIVELFEDDAEMMKLQYETLT